MAKYIYNCEVIKIKDGDTIDVNIDLGFNIILKETLRFYGINAYETKGEERELGLKAKEYLSNIMPVGSKIEIESHGKGKFGRVLATIHYEGLNINQHMIDMGHAIEYYC